jgi:hypothetical protein
VRVRPLNRLVPNWRSFLARVIREEHIKVLRAYELILTCFASASSVSLEGPCDAQDA